MNTSPPITPPEVARSPSCHGAAPNSNKMLGWQRSIAIVATLAVVAGGVAFAVDQRRLSVAALTPLLFTLPCAVMMFVCMRGAFSGTPAQPTAQQQQLDD